MQVTQGNFECVETVPTPDGDRLFAVVRRIVGGVGVRYIEMLDPDLNTDAALTGTSEAGATVWTRSEERRVGKECVSSVALGGRRIIKKKKYRRVVQRQYRHTQQ